MNTAQDDIEPLSVARVSITYRYKVDGTPDVNTKWDGDMFILLGMLEQAKELILRAELKGA